MVVGYRFVTEDLHSRHGEIQWKIGEWQYQDGELSLCNNGFHASKEPLDSLNYIFGTRWFKVEAKGKILQDTDKFCTSKMRLIKEIPIKVVVQFAVDCAKRVLPLFEKKFPEDKRPREAIEAVEAWLADPSEENHKKWAAAGDAAWAAAWAAWAAGDAAWAAWAAGDAAWAAWAAGDAAWAAWAAWAAARDAGDAERKWQRKHLKQLIKQALKEA